MLDIGNRAGRLGHIALCAMLALSLAACGGGSESKPDAAAAVPTDSPSVPAPSPPADSPNPPANNPPDVNNQPALAVKAGTAYSFVPSVTDADNDPLTFAITGKPDWANFDTATGTLSGTPGDTNVGQTADIEIDVSDGKTQSAVGPFRIQVLPKDSTPPPTNSPPTLTGAPATVVMALQPYIFVPVATDADNDTLTFSITNRPSWATFNAANGQLSGTPARSNVGTFTNIRITVSDGKVSTSLPAFQIQVTAPPNTAPVISGSPTTSVQAGAAYSFKPTATDVDGDKLVWSIQNKPAWAAFSTTTGQLSGTPTTANVGTYSNIRISVSDGIASSALGTFSIVVSGGPNTAPTISGTPTTSLKAGAAYSFTPTAADADKDTLSFSITNKPSWATFSIANGSLTGTAQAGTYSNVIISVSDGKASTPLAAFTITVAANAVPTISGSPATSVTAGSAYNFTPSASDADGDKLTFSITNKPTWASFSTTTGALTGTPAAANAGTTSNIVIAVSDGSATTSLAVFQITVNAPAATGSATLSWVPPTTNADGSLLTDLAGFRIYYGNSSGSLGQVVTIADASATSGTVGSLGTGTWYFSVKAYSASGMESTGSPVVSKTIN